jgi:hypothetical protein
MAQIEQGNCRDASQEEKRSEDRTNDNGNEEHQGAIRPGATGWGIHRA